MPAKHFLRCLAHGSCDKCESSLLLELFGPTITEQGVNSCLTFLRNLAVCPDPGPLPLLLGSTPISRGGPGVTCAGERG